MRLKNTGINCCWSTVVAFVVIATIGSICLVATIAAKSIMSEVRIFSSSSAFVGYGYRLRFVFVGTHFSSLLALVFSGVLQIKNRKQKWQLSITG